MYIWHCTKPHKQSIGCPAVCLHQIHFPLGWRRHCTWTEQTAASVCGARAINTIWYFHPNGCPVWFEVFERGSWEALCTEIALQMLLFRPMTALKCTDLVAFLAAGTIRIGSEMCADDETVEIVCVMQRVSVMYMYFTQVSAGERWHVRAVWVCVSAVLAEPRRSKSVPVASTLNIKLTNRTDTSGCFWCVAYTQETKNSPAVWCRVVLA